METAALQELRRRLSLGPTEARPAHYDPPPVVANPEGRLSPVDAHVVESFPEIIIGCNNPILRDMPCPFTTQIDATLCRFLRARNYDVDKAEKMYRACVEVRQKWQVDSIMDEEDPLEELWQSSVPVCHLGHDKRGRPVIIER